MIKPLVFTGNHHQIQRAETLGIRFYVQPPATDHGWRWGVWDMSKTAHMWIPCDSEEEGKALCNEAWREILEPFLETSIEDPVCLCGMLFSEHNQLNSNHSPVSAKNDNEKEKTPHS